MGRTRKSGAAEPAGHGSPGGSTAAAEPISPADPANVERLLVRYQVTIRRRLPVLLLSLVSGLLLTLSFSPFNWWFVPWFALAPWLVAIATSQRWGWMLFCSWLTGSLFFALNMYWLLACGYPGSTLNVLQMAGAQLALSAYMGLYFLLFAYVVGGLVRRWRPDQAGASGAAAVPRPSGLLMTYLVPIAWVATEFLRGYVMSGFPWFILGHSMYRHVTLIQVADLGGAYAVSFLIAAVNGLLADGLLQPLFLSTRKGPRPNYQVSAATLAVLGLVLLCFVYGRYRIGQFESAIRPGPRIAAIQAKYPITLQPVEDDATIRRTAHHEALARAAAAGNPRPDLVIWPETMVDANLNKEWLGLRLHQPDLTRFRPEDVDNVRQAAAEIEAFWRHCRRTDAEINALVREYRVAMLVGANAAMPQPESIGAGPINIIGLGRLMYTDPTGLPSEDNPQILRYNSAFLYQLAPRGWGGDGPATSRPDVAATMAAESALDVANSEPVLKDRYDKHHLVPFGEYIPFRTSWPWGFGLLRKFTPMALLIPGQRLTPMTAFARDGQAYRLAAPICYEDVVPQATMPLVYDRPASRPPVGWLLAAGLGGLTLAFIARRRGGSRATRLAVAVFLVAAAALMLAQFRPGSGRKSADIIANISNDGWFAGTTELEQHWSTAVFRCVETRTPMARSVNCGCSGFIDSAGRAMGRLEPGAVGHLSAAPPLDGRTTIYSRLGDWPWFLCAVLLMVGMTVVSVRRPARSGRAG